MATSAHSTSDMLDTAERRAFVLQLRKGGATYMTIAQAARELFGEDALPNGWDERYAYKDVKRELDHLRKDIAHSTEEIVELETQRLDAMLMVLWPQVSKGDQGAIDRVLRIMDRRAKLLGLDTPQQLNALIRNINLAQLTDEQLARITEGEDLLYVIANPSTG